MVWTSRCVLVLARDLHLHGPYGWDCIGFLRADLHGLYEQVCMVCPAFIVFTTCMVFTTCLVLTSRRHGIDFSFVLFCISGIANW